MNSKKEKSKKLKAIYLKVDKIGYGGAEREMLLCGTFEATRDKRGSIFRVGYSILNIEDIKNDMTQEEKDKGNKLARDIAYGRSIRTREPFVLLRTFMDNKKVGNSILISYRDHIQRNVLDYMPFLEKEAMSKAVNNLTVIKTDLT